MKRSPWPRGVVGLASLDMRRRPDHRSELLSQALLGEVVRVRGATRDGRWWRVENLSDGYPGWVRTWGLVGVSARRAAAWERRARARVVVPHAEVRAGRGAGPLVSPLFWNGRLIAGRRAGGFRPVELPDGRRGWVRAAVLAPARARRPSVLERVRSLLGAPYLWGGRTALGLDCSALTQQVLWERGIRLPRDAAQQYARSRPLPAGEEPRPGDLAFFGPGPGRPGHVGLALGGGYYAHARGRVMISSNLIGNPWFDKELYAQFRGWRRPVAGPPGAPGAGRGGRESA